MEEKSIITKWKRFKYTSSIKKSRILLWKMNGKDHLNRLGRNSSLKYDTVADIQRMKRQFLQGEKWTV